VDLLTAPERATPAVTHHRMTVHPRHPQLALVGASAELVDAYRMPPEEERRLRMSHDVPYLACVIAGTVDHVVGGQRWREGPGSLSVVAPGVGHLMITPDGPATIANVFLDPDHRRLPPLAPELATALLGFLPVHPGLVRRANRLQHLRFSDPAVLRPVLDGLIAESCPDAGLGAADALLGHVRVLCVLLARAVLAAGPGPAQTAEDPVMEQLEAHLETSFAEPWTLADLADRCALPIGTFRRRFQRHAGVAALTFIQQRRLQAAAVALRTTADGILAIALRTGFADLSWFNRAFRATFGCTPGAYRRRWVGTDGS
jgi:AraC-like DNA-binding protein